MALKIILEACESKIFAEKAVDFDKETVIVYPSWKRRPVI